jgi:hypothetical protein
MLAGKTIAKGSFSCGGFLTGLSLYKTKRKMKQKIRRRG